MSSIFEIHGLLAGEASHLHQADCKLRAAIEKIPETASSDVYLNAAFGAHFEQTRNYLNRIVQAMRMLGISDTAIFPRDGEESFNAEETLITTDTKR